MLATPMAVTFLVIPVVLLGYLFSVRKLYRMKETGEAAPAVSMRGPGIRAIKALSVVTLAIGAAALALDIAMHTSPVMDLLIVVESLAVIIVIGRMQTHYGSA